MRWVGFLPALLGLALGQVTNFGAVPVEQGSISTEAQLRDLLRQPGAMHIVVPELTNWTFYLAQLHQPYGSTSVYVNRPEARKYCGAINTNANLSLVKVLASEETPRPAGFILPPSGGNLQGTLMEGEGLYKEMVLSKLPDPLAAWYGVIGPKPGRAYVYGSPSQGNLKAQVYLRELTWVQDSYPSLIGSYSFAAPWNGQLQVDLGRGAENLRVVGYDPTTPYRGQTLRVQDASGQDVGYVVVSSQVNRRVAGVSGVDVASEQGCDSLWDGRTLVLDLGDGPEQFYLSGCYTWREGLFGTLLRGGCNIYDSAGRLRGVPQQGGGRTFYGMYLVYGDSRCGFGNGYSWSIYRLRYETAKISESVTLYARRWRQTQREVYKGEFPVLPGGKVVVEGATYSIPELASYLMNSSITLKYARKSPLVSYLSRQIGLEEGSLVDNRLGLANPPERPKPLREFCLAP